MFNYNKKFMKRLSIKRIFRLTNKFYTRFRLSMMFLFGKLDRYIIIAISDKDVENYLTGKEVKANINYYGIDKSIMFGYFKAVGNEITDEMIKSELDKSLEASKNY